MMIITFEMILMIVISVILLKMMTKMIKKNIPRIGKLPYGAKRGFFERKVLLKERLY